MNVRRLKYFEDLDDDIQEQIRLNYPLGGKKHMVSIKRPNGEMAKALPFDTAENSYLVIMEKPKNLKPKKLSFKFRPTKEDIEEMENEVDLD